MSKGNEGKVYDIAEKRRQHEAETAKAEAEAAQTAAEPAASRTPDRKVARVEDGIEYDEQGQPILRAEELAKLGAIQPKNGQQHHGDLAARLYATEAELADMRVLLNFRTLEWVKAMRQVETLRQQLNAAAAPPEPTPPSTEAPDPAEAAG